MIGRVVRGPLVVVVEEAHWADGASVALLNRLAFATEGRPWAVVVVRRGETGGFAPGSGVRVDLQPLPREVIEHLVHAATEATPLRPHEVAAIVERAEGNPLFVEEVTRLTVGSGSLEQLPESVHAAMSTQIDRLAPTTRRILRFCAVLGRSFRREVLQRILAVDDLTLDQKMLTALASFIEDDGEDRLRFRNSLVRDAAYEGLAFRVRSRIHRMAGEVLEDVSTDLDVDSPTLALHFERASDAPRTWRYSLMAGTLAERSYANADAARHLENAIDVSRRVPGVSDDDRATLWTRIGRLSELAGMFEASVNAYRRAERLLQADPLGRAKVLELRATVHTRTGELAAATRAVGRARRLLDEARRRRAGHRRAPRRTHGAHPRRAGAAGRRDGLGGAGGRRGPGHQRPGATRPGAGVPGHRGDLHGRPRPRGATPGGSPDLHRRGPAPPRGGRQGKPRNAVLLRRPLDRGRAVVPDRAGGRDGGRQGLRRRRDGRQPRRAPHQPGQRRRR